MSRKIGHTEAQYRKWIKEGRGIGEYQDYKPWLTVYLSQDLRTYAVKRFDIKPKRKIGVEDFTVLMGSANTQEAKYQSSYENVMNFTAKYTGGNPRELRTMYSYIVFAC